MAGTARPKNTYISQVFNWGVDKNIPTGLVNVVYEKTGKAVGYMQGNSFYPLGVDPVEYDKEQKESPTFFGPGLGNRPTAEQNFSNLVTTKGLVVTTAPGVGTYVSGPEANGKELFLYLSTKPDSKGDYEELVTLDYDVVRNKILSEANSTPGGIQNLFDSLYRSGAISKDTYEKKDFSSQEFNKGLAYAIRDYSVKQIDNITLGNQKSLGGFIDFLGSGSGMGTGLAGTRASYESVVTLRQDAAEDINRFFIDRFGYGATKQQEDAYYLALRDLEKQNSIKRTTTYDAEGRVVNSVSSGELVSEGEKLLLLGKIASKSVKDANLDKIASSGGKAAQDIDDLISYAANYGIQLSQQDALNYVGQQLKKGTTIDSSKSKILQLAKNKYSNLGDSINDEITVDDIALTFKQRLAKLTGISINSITANNPLIEKALANDGKKGTMSTADFDKLIKTNPETRAMWLQQPETKDEAASYALNILQMFGLVA